MDESKALKHWFQENHQELFSYLFRLTGNRQFSEDILQETYIKAYIKFHLFKPGRGTMKNWLFRIAQNLFHDFCRSRSKESSFVESQSEATLNQSTYHHDKHERIGKSARMKRAFAQLDDEKRSILLLAARHSLSDVAEILDIPIGTVKSRIFYARKILNEKLDQIQKEEERQ